MIINPYLGKGIQSNIQDVTLESQLIIADTIYSSLRVNVAAGKIRVKP